MKRNLLVATLMTIAAAVVAEESTETNTSRAGGATPASALVESSSSSAGTRFGVGLMVGEPTGASLKYFFTDNFAMDGGLGWAFHHETDFHVHADALWHKHDLFDTSEGQLSLYFGVGGRVKFRDHAEDRVGVRIPLGVSYKFDDAPVDLFVEVAPIIDFTPSTEGSFSAAIGARYWF